MAFNLVLLIQSSILILMLLLLDRVLRKRVRAVLRYWIWLLVLLKLVLPPDLSLPTSPSYWLEADAAGIVSQQFPERDLSKQAAPMPGLGHFTSGLALSTEQAAPNTASTVPRSIPVFHTGTRSGPNGDVSAVSAPEPTPRGQALASLQWQGRVFLIWLAVVILASVFLLKRWLHVKKLIAGSQEPDQSLVDLLEQCRRKLGVRACIRLRILSITGSPSVCGLFRPTILIPHNLLGELGQAQLRSILVHELAHIKRGDLWCSLVQTVLQIAYFYNALLWIANYIIRTVREKAVDEMVLVNLGEEADDYPRTLLDISQLAFQRPLFSLRLIGVVESKKELIGRIQHMANRPVPKSARLGLIGVTALAVLAVTLLPMAKAHTAKPASDVSVERKEGEDEHDQPQPSGLGSMRLTHEDKLEQADKQRGSTKPATEESHENPVFTDRDDSGRIIRQWAFAELSSRRGNVLEVSQPFMNLYLDDLTCKISADKGRLRQETGRRDQFPKAITLSGNVLIHVTPESGSSYSLEAQTISIDLADHKDSQAISLAGDLRHMEAHGGTVKLGIYTRARAHVNEFGSAGESQTSGILVGAELECQRIVYDPNSGQGVFTATGPGKIRYNNAQSQGTGKLGAQQRPCYAFLDGFETLKFLVAENRIVLSSDNRMQFEYFPIVDGQTKERIYAEAKHVEIGLSKTQAGKLDLGTLTARGDVYYEADDKDREDKLSCTANSISYDHRLATVTMWGDMNEPCMVNGMSVKGIQYNLKTKDLQTQLGPVVVGPKRFSLENSVTTGEPPDKPRIVRQRFVPGAAPQSPMESSDSAVWSALHPRAGELFLQAWAGIGHKFPVQKKDGPMLFEVALTQGNDERLVIEVRSEDGIQTVELKRDTSVPVKVAGITYKLLYPSCHVSSAENRSTTNKAMLIIARKTQSVDFPVKWRVTVEKGDVLANASEGEREEIFIVPHDQVDLIPPCRASVVLEMPCSVVLKTIEGVLFHIGGPDATDEVNAFISTFSQGETYTFPDVFREFEKRKGQPPDKPHSVRQRFVPGAVPQSPMESSDSAVWSPLHPGPDPQGGELFLQAWAGIGHSFPVKKKGGPTLFELALIQGNDERLVVEVRSQEGIQAVELKRDTSVPVKVAGVTYKLLYPSCHVSSAENRPTTNKAMLIVACKTETADSPARGVHSGSTPSKVLILPSTRLVSSSAPDTENFIQAYVTLADESGAHLKHPGTFRFELYEKRPGSTEPRGKRTNIWPDLDLAKPEQNNRYWQDSLRAYEFRLDFVPESSQMYILQATFLGVDGKRLSVQAPLEF